MRTEVEISKGMTEDELKRYLRARKQDEDAYVRRCNTEPEDDRADREYERVRQREVDGLND